MLHQNSTTLYYMTLFHFCSWNYIALMKFYFVTLKEFCQVTLREFCHIILIAFWYINGILLHHGNCYIMLLNSITLMGFHTMKLQFHYITSC